MKTRAVASSAMVALLLIGMATVALASTGPSVQGDRHNGQASYKVGEILKFNPLVGHFNNLTNSSVGRAGRSTGNFVFNVTKITDTSTTLTIVKGNFTIGKVTYTISSGQVVLNAGGRSGNGTGTASGGATFTIRLAGIHQNHRTGMWTANIKLDVTVGKSEYHVILVANNRPEGHHHGKP